MARNGSGNYNRAVSPYTAGTTITAATVNSEMDDIATALTGSMARDGQSPATANIPMGGFRLTGLGNAIASTDAAPLGQVLAKAGDTMTGALNYAPEVDLASATTTDIGAQTSNNVRITGTTTITSLGTAANGVTRQLRFAGALTLTHNATSLILPGGANITTAAGDTAKAVSLGSGNWVVVDFMPANGWRGAPVVLAEAVASASATLDIVGVFNDAIYARYELELIDLVPATNDVQALLRVGTGVGPTWQASGGAYNNALLAWATASQGYPTAISNAIALSQQAGGSNGVHSGGFYGLVRFWTPQSARIPTFNIDTVQVSTTPTVVSVRGSGIYAVATAITGLRFLFSSGNVSSGSIRLIGYRK